MQQPSRLFDLPAYQLEFVPGLNMFYSKNNDVYQPITTVEFMQRVDLISRGLIAFGVEKGEKIALISENRVEWNMLDFAIQQIGAVLVAVYPNISSSDYTYIFNDAEIKTCIVSNQGLYNKITDLKNTVHTLQNICTIDVIDQIPNWNTIIDLHPKVSTEALEEIKAQIQTTDLATIIYTSGTTGHPKGVMLSHKNILADMVSSEYSTPVGKYNRALTFLPVCHAYERLFHYLYMYKGCSIYFAESLDTLGVNMKEVKPHIFSAVPRVLEKVYEKIQHTGSQLTGLKRKIFDWSMNLGEQYTFENRSAWYDFKLGIARKLVFSKWIEALGGDIKGVASGSAPLQIKLIKLFSAAGIPIYEGYGLTEAAPCIAVNCYRRGMKMGTVGLPLINMEIKLAQDGEIMIKGDNVMMGYYNNPEATAEVIKDGWLYTGDIGIWEDGKFLKIVDRKKEMFKTSGGKYVVPQQLENKFVESPFIEQIMVVGEAEKYPAAFIVPSMTKLKEWAKTAHPELLTLDTDALLKHPEVDKKIQEIVNTYNKEFGNWEQIKKFILLKEEFTIESGMLTPTLKLKRKVILKAHQDAYNTLFHKVI